MLRWPQWIRLGIAVACTLAIFAMTWLPAPSSPPLFSGMDKAVHFGSFFVLALAWSWAGLAVAWALGLGLVLAAVTEYGQGLLPWPRSPDLLDLGADAIGVVVGVSLSFFARRLTAQAPRTTPPSEC